MTEETDILYRALYATDASMYQMLPLAVEKPASKDEALQIIKRCAAEERPILARGAGTSLTGQAINHAVILDLSKHHIKMVLWDFAW